MDIKSLSSKVSQCREMLQLHRHFKKYFKIVPATTCDLAEEAQRIRHAVYCEELGWEPVNEQGLEVDIYDKNSVHCLLLAVNSGRYIGCFRLVLPNPDNLNSSFPLQELYDDDLYSGYPEYEKMSKGEVAEVSRMTIMPDYRRRKNEKNSPVSSLNFRTDVDARGKRRFPYIPVGLYIGMLEMASFYKIKTLYMLTEPFLATHFSRLGCCLKPIGDVVDYRGRRRPYVMEVEDVLKSTSLLMRPLIWTIRKDVKAALAGVQPMLDLEIKGQEKKWREREAI
ncbi:PEP-CTERM/exosortase system-associated acyltransferase [Syntrophotalea acetylenica]|uniref:PEP-CTERM/exosortase system-associated acyltransferase n=1 Tax=Syntrophotalea acetylenica TaxID=29542 RepID=UPI002A35E37E|nr:PEP-CTERM/exosortase system-associated acyltransferase [Syntrophotalea acetylenica]MDY0263348.1 PEP-CTERM/exosortase system-associated acyltransferase [Syntrophotalea acetylenica]